MTDSALRETRVETLESGDRLRWLGEWFDVLKVRIGVGRPGYIVGVTVDDRGPSGRDREFVYQAGVFVAAECPR